MFTAESLIRYSVEIRSGCCCQNEVLSNLQALSRLEGVEDQGVLIDIHVTLSPHRSTDLHWGITMRAKSTASTTPEFLRSGGFSTSFQKEDWFWSKNVHSAFLGTT